MSDKQKAMLILEAIGELSEKTVAEAKCPANKAERREASRNTRDHSLLAASIALILAISAALILGIVKYQTRTVTPGISTPDELTQDVGMDYAVKAAMDSLSEEGVSSTLIQAVLVNDADRPYYLVKLSSKNGSYDCEVDAQSGKVTNIAHRIEATEPPPTEIINAETEPRYEEDYDDDCEEENDDYDVPSIEIDLGAIAESEANGFKEWNDSHGGSNSSYGGMTGNNSYPDEIRWDYN